jgi:hypothetical protein
MSSIRGGIWWPSGIERAPAELVRRLEPYTDNDCVRGPMRKDAALTIDAAFGALGVS